MKQKIIGSVIAVALVLGAFLLGKGCKEVVTIEPDNTVIIDQVEKIKQDSIRIINLMDMIKVYEQRIRESQELIIGIREIANNAIKHNKVLPLDSSVKLMAENFADKKEIELTVSGFDTTAGIHLEQIREVNQAFMFSDYFMQYTIYQGEQIENYIKKDSIYAEIVRSHDQISAGKDVIIGEQDKENKALQEQNAKEVKRTKWQRVQKYFWKGVAGAAIIFSIAK